MLFMAKECTDPWVKCFHLKWENMWIQRVEPSQMCLRFKKLSHRVWWHMMVNPGMQEVEAGISGSQGRLQLQRKFKASRAPGSMRHCLWKWKQYKKRSGSCHITPLGSQMKIWWLGGWDNMPRRVLMISSGWSWTVHSLASASKVGHHTARSEPFCFNLYFASFCVSNASGQVKFVTIPLSLGWLLGFVLLWHPTVAMLGSSCARAHGTTPKGFILV